MLRSLPLYILLNFYLVSQAYKNIQYVLKVLSSRIEHVISQRLIITRYKRESQQQVVESKEYPIHFREGGVIPFSSLVNLNS